MNTKVQTSLRLNADKFIEARLILSQLGLNFSEAVNIFTSLVVAKKGLPFEVVIPNKTTQTAMREVLAKKNLEEVTLEQLQKETHKKGTRKK